MCEVLKERMTALNLKHDRKVGLQNVYKVCCEQSIITFSLISKEEKIRLIQVMRSLLIIGFLVLFVALSSTMADHHRSVVDHHTRHNTRAPEQYNNHLLAKRAAEPGMGDEDEDEDEWADEDEQCPPECCLPCDQLPADEVANCKKGSRGYTGCGIGKYCDGFCDIYGFLREDGFVDSYN